MRFSLRSRRNASPKFGMGALDWSQVLTATVFVNVWSEIGIPLAKPSKRR
jgi:hypothetical protein